MVGHKEGTLRNNGKERRKEKADNPLIMLLSGGSLTGRYIFYPHMQRDEKRRVSKPANDSVYFSTLTTCNIYCNSLHFRFLATRAVREVLS